jgi:hypothetical protein
MRDGPAYVRLASKPVDPEHRSSDERRIRAFPRLRRAATRARHVRCQAMLPPITCMRYSRCRRTTLIFQHDGAGSRGISAAMRSKSASQPSAAPMANAHYGSADFGNTPSATKTILPATSITFISVRSNTASSLKSAIGRTRHSTYSSGQDCCPTIGPATGAKAGRDIANDRESG